MKKGYILPVFDEIQVDLIHTESENYVGCDFHRLTWSTLLKQGRTIEEVEGIHNLTYL